MWWSLWWVSVWAQEEPPVCPADAGAAAVAAADLVSTAWYGLDEATYLDARAQLDLLLPCVVDALDPVQATIVHRAHAISAYVDGDLDASRRAFAAVRTLDPAWTLPADKVAPDHPLWALWAQSLDTSAPARTVPLRELPAHGWSVDGTRYDAAPDDTAAPFVLPLDRAFVLQVFEDDSRAAYTGYHLSVADVPADRLALEVDPRHTPAARQRRAHLWGSVVGGALLAGAATTFGLGWTGREAITSGDTELRDIEAVAQRSNVLGDVSYGLAGASALAVTVAWSVRW